jgi:glycosyltransferase involved in cell wall biosynthesis
LKSIIEQTYKNIEIIVVDNYSTDKTRLIIKNFQHQTSNVELFTCGPERSAQRNFGAKKARGKYYLFLDADMTLSPHVVSECVDMFENCKLKIENLSGLYIPEIVLGNGFWPKVRRFERTFYNATVIDCVRFVRLNDFNKVQGFDESLSGPEDWDFDKKIRQLGRTALIKSCLFHDEKNFNLQKYLDKKSYYTLAFGRYVIKWGKSDPDIRKQLGFYYRYFGVFIERGKWLLLLKHPILSLSMYFLKIAVGVKYLQTKWGRKS